MSHTGGIGPEMEQTCMQNKDGSRQTQSTQPHWLALLFQANAETNLEGRPGVKQYGN